MNNSFHFVRLTRICHVLECWEAFLNGWADGRHGDDIGETQVPHNGTSHQPASLIMAMDIGHHKQAHTVWPGDLVELIPPAFNNNTDIETQHKRHRDKLVIALTVPRYSLKYSTNIKLSIESYQLYTVLYIYLKCNRKKYSGNNVIRHVSRSIMVMVDDDAKMIQ